MQDRFKFRVWNKLSNTMTYNFMFGNFMQKSLEDYEKKDWVGLNYEPDYICFNNKAIEDNLVIMQSTGLKDKNGKLIYEGDILIQKEENAGPTKKLVIWEEDGGYLGLKDLKKSFFGVVTFHRFGYTYEVIGNIYENPELLEVSNDH